MNKLESLKLFQDLQLVSTKYTHLKLKDNDKEVEDNRKLNSLLEFYKSNINQIKERSHFVSKQTRDELKNSNPKDIYKALIDLNNFANEKYNFIKSSDMDIESTTVRAVMLSTVDELVLINESIKNKDYLKDKNTYFYIYEKIDAKMVFDAFRENDEVAIETINRFKVYLSKAMASMINTLDPDVISIGGGVSRASDIILDDIENLIKNHILYKKEEFAKIVPATLGADAGIIGAAFLS